jgi:Ca2+-binding EF-hand superfamily protein
MWPSWIIKEGKLQYAQGLLASMHRVLEHEHGITAEQAFGIYDMKDTGECSRDEFLRVLTIFFGDKLQSPETDLQLLMKLTVSRADKRIDYREFCKFLSKRVVRAFKNQSLDDGGAGGKSRGGAKHREGPLRKEATLTYVLTKAAELGYDLRKIFLENDKNELSVLPRAKFVGLMLDLPLGLNEVEMQEILENDLNFDNYGNVDYTVILNSEEFVGLEAERVKEAIKKKKGVRVAMGGEHVEDKDTAEVEKVDNTKVVVEDLIYIDDLEILIYTTLVPRTSTVWITSCKKSTSSSSTK